MKEKIKDLTIELLEKLELNIDSVEVVENNERNENFDIRIKTPDSAILIGKHWNTFEDLKNILKQISKIELKKQIFSWYSIFLLDKLKPKIEYLASNYFTIITNHKYSSITLDREYKIKIDEKNLNLYSGGEQDLANLCLRIALWQNLSITNSWNMINFLILDEVLGSQDNKRQENILIALKKLETKFSQIILISHIDWLKDAGDNLIEVKNINNLESEILEF